MKVDRETFEWLVTSKLDSSIMKVIIKVALELEFGLDDIKRILENSDVDSKDLRYVFIAEKFGIEYSIVDGEFESKVDRQYLDVFKDYRYKLTSEKGKNKLEIILKSNTFHHKQILEALLDHCYFDDYCWKLIYENCNTRNLSDFLVLAKHMVDANNIDDE